MADAAKHKQQIAALEQAKTKDDKVKILQDFQASFKNAQYSNPDVVKDIFQKSNLLTILATLLDENKAAWAKELPKWLDGLLDGLSNCSAVSGLFPLDQFKTLSNAFKKYVVSGSLGALSSYSLLACFDEVQQHLLTDNELYTALKKDLKNPGVLQFLYNIARGDVWQTKLLEDKQLINDLLALPESEDVWDLFVNLAHHRDAKVLLPKQVLVQANKSSYIRCADLCALLCSDIDLNVLKLNDLWIDNTAKLLTSLLKDGQVSANGIYYDLLDLILPLANFTTILAKQEALGKRVVPLLLKVIADDLPKTYPIQGKIKRGRTEAAWALWNLSYTESNRNLINAENGVARLKTALANIPAQPSELTLKRGIEGVLYMLSAPFSGPPKASGGPTPGHIMLSYNWGSQPIVQRLAQSLKDKGYSVWFDLDQMKGDTLEAMANAVEKAELVLICMSQKYKDSANCRLEGEYCIYRKAEYVPLLMQANYRPDGWLGITLGTRLYHDFSDDKDWDTKVAALIKEIGERGKANAAKRVQAAPATPAVPARKPVIEWSIDDIREWMKAEQLEQHFDAFKKHRMDGKALSELKTFFVPHNPSFFSYVGDQFAITAMGELLRLSAAIRKL